VTREEDISLEKLSRDDGAEDQEAASRGQERHAHRPDHRQGHRQQTRLPLATRDAQADCGWARRSRERRFLERAAELIRAGVDVLVIDMPRAFSGDGDGDRSVPRAFGDFEMIAGNVATAEGAAYLAERGVNGIKVGIGPGGGCTTRLNTNSGAQLQALVECRMAVGSKIPLIADGGSGATAELSRRCCLRRQRHVGQCVCRTAETPGTR